MPAPTVLAHLRRGECSFVLAETDGIVHIAHYGADLGSETPALSSRGVTGGGLDAEIVAGIFPQPAHGWYGRPGFVITDPTGATTCPDLRLDSVSVTEDQVTSRVHVSLRDADDSGVSVQIEATMRGDGGVDLRPRVLNDSARDVRVSTLSVCIPAGDDAAEVLTLGGRHAMEAVIQRTPWGRSVISVENRTGRTSHENLGVVFVGSTGFSEQSGHVLGAHLAWSGNHTIHCDGVTGAMRTVSVGALPGPAGHVVSAGATWSAPAVALCHSFHGLNPASRQFHERLRALRPQRAATRRVVMNTWEAVYFDHNLDVLKRLADVAVSVGAERFVLDDGWFHARRNDTRGLGDWWVDDSVWPGGLSPIIDHVTSQGMDFGLWFEPEMVNPDSDLFRANPQWALDGTRANPPLGRNQLVLDMSRKDVRDHLFDRMSDVLAGNDIAYVKWDHNRPLVGGEPIAQTEGTYELLTRLRDKFPRVEFESCASGGGRVDHGIGQFVDRFWTSDSIDALDRLSIQRGTSLLVPAEMMGSHVGSPVCHTTGRRHALSFRAATAMFGWMGIEWNLLQATERELSGLRTAIALHKEWREVLHAGHVFRGDHPDDTIHVHGVIARDVSCALVSVSRLRSGPSNHSANVTVQGLRDDVHYDVTVVPNGSPRWALHRALPSWIGDGITLTGRELAVIGLPMPALLPESTFLVSMRESQR